jgi:hypothetical protein
MGAAIGPERRTHETARAPNGPTNRTPENPAFLSIRAALPDAVRTFHKSICILILEIFSVP